MCGARRLEDDSLARMRGKVWLSIVRLGVACLTCTGLGVACVDNGEPEAAALIKGLDCADERRSETDPAEPARPTNSWSCRIGDNQVSVSTYETASQRDEVMSYLDQFAGYRVVGQHWIVAVDTPEAAETVRSRVGGRVVELAGTRSRS